MEILVTQKSSEPLEIEDSKNKQIVQEVMRGL